MQARETNLFKFLEGNKQFIIPIYQRTYSWQREQCEQLWHDIVRAATRSDVSAHFVGSVVYIQEGLYKSSGVSQMLVIDGQQRLTTMTLLLAALVQTINKGEILATIKTSKIVNSYLTNQDEDGDERYKLILTQSDRPTLLSVVDGREIPETYSPRIKENYDYFTEQLRKAEIAPQIIYDGIGKLVLVDIALDRDHDNPQLIFESLNSTGLDLSQADLIRNYILMRLEPNHQRTLYDHHWFPMEQLFGPTHYASHFDGFMRDYLTVKMRAIPNKDDIYKVFKVYRESQADIAIDEIVADIHHFAKLYTRLVFERETDGEIRDAIREINDIEVNVAYPFLLEAFDDFSNGRLNKDDLLAIILLVESYVFRRAICGIPTNSMNKTFANLMRDIDKSNYRANVEAAFMVLSSYKRFPRDDEFRSNLEAKDVYHFQRRNYLLRKLENHGRKERVKIEGFTIEHIMPQNPNLSAMWQNELGPDWKDIQTRYLHTIGNLTLTGYNSEMSDRSFAEKRDIAGGFKQSPLYLNEGLGQLQHWNVETIQKRATQLAERAIAIWNIPAGVDAPISQESGYGKYTLEHYQAHSNSPAIYALLRDLRRRILNLDAGVQESMWKLGISYGIPDEFAWVRPFQRQISIVFFGREEDLDDFHKLLHHGTIEAKTGRQRLTLALKSEDQLDYAIYLIEQALLLRRDRIDNELGTASLNSMGDEPEDE